MSGLYTEDIELIMYSTIERHYDDDYLRQISYRYASNGPNNYTSHATVDVRNSVDRIEIHARNNIGVNGATFKVQVHMKSESTSTAGTIYLVISGLFALTTCVLCTASIVRCYMRDSHINWNVEDINPHWDEDQIRIYHIRRL